MASEVLSLFGGQTPQQLRGAALDSMMISPTQMGSQGLLQQVVSMGQNAGTMLGMGAGQLLGGKVAGEVEAAYLDDAIKSASGMKDATPSQKMEAVATSLADKPGMGRQYMMALQEARRLKAEEMQMAEAEFKTKNRTRDVYVPVIKTDSNGLPYETTERVTQEWVDGKWVTIGKLSQSPTQTTGKGDNSKEDGAKAELRKRMQAIGMGENQSELESRRLLQVPPPPPKNKITPGGGGGLIIPEEFR